MLRRAFLAWFARFLFSWLLALGILRLWLASAGLGFGLRAQTQEVQQSLPQTWFGLPSRHFGKTHAAVATVSVATAGTAVAALSVAIVFTARTSAALRTALAIRVIFVLFV